MGIDRKTMDSLRHNRNITAITIERLCTILDCLSNDIIEFVADEKIAKMNAKEKDMVARLPVHPASDRQEAMSLSTIILTVINSIFNQS